MESRKLTLDIIKEYIKNNISSFSNEEIVIEIKPTKKYVEINNNLKKETVKKETVKKETFNDYMNKLENSKEHRDIIFPCNFFDNLSNINFLKDFLILNPITIYDIDAEEDININSLSFYYSILTAVEPQFLKEKTENKKKLYNDFISYLKKDIMIDGFKQHKYSLMKWNKNDIFKNLEKNIIDDKIIRYISDALHINIFYIDKEKIKYVGGDFIVFKKIVLLLKYNNNYYLIHNNIKIFNFNSNEFIKNIIINPENIELVFSESFNTVGTDWNKIKPIEIKPIEIKSNDNKSPDVVYTDKLNGYDIDEDTINEAKLTNDIKKINKNNEFINDSMSLIELQKKAKELNIDIFKQFDNSRKMKNKKELCNDILEKI
jgi:hypothetical protein